MEISLKLFRMMSDLINGNYRYWGCSQHRLYKKFMGRYNLLGIELEVEIKSQEYSEDDTDKLAEVFKFSHGYHNLLNYGNSQRRKVHSYPGGREFEIHRLLNITTPKQFVNNVKKLHRDLSTYKISTLGGWHYNFKLTRSEYEEYEDNPNYFSEVSRITEGEAYLEDDIITAVKDGEDSYGRLELKEVTSTLLWQDTVAQMFLTQVLLRKNISAQDKLKLIQLLIKNKGCSSLKNKSFCTDYYTRYRLRINKLINSGTTKKVRRGRSRGTIVISRQTMAQLA